MAHVKLPGHVRATYTFYMVGPGDIEVAASIKNMTHTLDFAEDDKASAPDFMLAMGMTSHLVDGFRFMTAEETADYLRREDEGDDFEDEEAA